MYGRQIVIKQLEFLEIHLSVNYVLFYPTLNRLSIYRMPKLHEIKETVA